MDARTDWQNNARWAPPQKDRQRDTKKILPAVQIP